MAIFLKEIELKSDNNSYRLSPIAISPYITSDKKSYYPYNYITSDKKSYYPYNIYLYSDENYSNEQRLGLGWFTEKELALIEEHGLPYLKTLLKI